MILGLGWLVLKCCPRSLRAVHPAVRVGWAWCLGALALAVAMEWLLLLHVPSRLSAVLLTLAGLIGIALGVREAVQAQRQGGAMLSRRRRVSMLTSARADESVAPRRLLASSPPRFLASLPLAIALVPILLAFFSALYRPLDQTDERYNFAIKAKVFFHEGRLRPLTEEWVPHPRYPLLVPLLEVFTSGLAGRFDELAVKPPFAAYFGVLVLLFYGEARRHFGPRASGFFASLLAWLPFWTLSETGMTSAGGDIPVAVHLLALLLALRWLIVQPGRDRAVLAVLLAVGLAFTKNEGLALVLFSALGVGLWMIGRRRARSPGVRWLVGTGAAIALLLAPWWWMVFQTPAELGGENYLSRLSVENLRSGLVRVPIFFRLLIEEAFLNVHKWVLTWWTLPLALFVLGKSLVRDPAASLAAVVMACYGLLFVVIWMVTPHSPEMLAGTALPRLLGHVAPLAWWLVLLAGCAKRKRTKLFASPRGDRLPIPGSPSR